MLEAMQRVVKKARSEDVERVQRRLVHEEVDDAPRGH